MQIFELENAVMFNRGQAYVTRSLVSENAALIRKNYECVVVAHPHVPLAASQANAPPPNKNSAAFTGNRQLANQNTDDLFRNRQALIRNIDATTPVAVNFKEALTNKAKLEYLEHRSKLNERVLKNSEDLAAINKQLIEVNRHILDTNEEVVTFNSTMCVLFFSQHAPPPGKSD